MDNILYLIIAFILGGLIPVLVQVFKDKTITRSERELLIKLAVQTTKDLIKVGTAKNKEQLIMASTNIVIRKLKENNITGFDREEIETIIEMIYVKLE